VETVTDSFDLEVPPFTAVELIRHAPSRAWREAITVTPSGAQGKPEPIVNNVVRVVLPDNYVGIYEVHLIAEDGTRWVAAEGRRYPPLDNT
jgi:hypothetical protein